MKVPKWLIAALPPAARILVALLAAYLAGLPAEAQAAVAAAALNLAGSRNL